MASNIENVANDLVAINNEVSTQEDLIGQIDMLLDGRAMSGVWEKLVDFTSTEEIISTSFANGDNGQTFSDYSRIAVLLFHTPVVDNTVNNFIKISFDNYHNAWSTSSYVLATNTPTYGTSGARTSFAMYENICGNIFPVANYESLNGTTARSMIKIPTSSTGLGIINTIDHTTDMNNILDEPYTTFSTFERISIGSYYLAIGIGTRILVWGCK